MRKKETAIVLATLVVLVGVGYILNQRHDLQRAREESLHCVSTLKQLNLGAEAYFVTHGASETPENLKEMVLSMKGPPKFLFCPSDPNYPVVAAMNWSGFDDALAPSYVGHLENGYDETTPGNVVFECTIHGHKALMDGSVQTPTNSKSLLRALFTN